MFQKFQAIVDPQLSFRQIQICNLRFVNMKNGLCAHSGGSLSAWGAENQFCRKQRRADVSDLNPLFFFNNKI